LTSYKTKIHKGDKVALTQVIVR